MYYKDAATLAAILAVAFCFLLISFNLFTSAYGHGTQNGPIGAGRALIDDEQFSDAKLSTNEELLITGTIRNVRNQTQEFVPNLLVVYSSYGGSDNEVKSLTSPYAGLLELFYPPYRESPTWNFRIEHSLPSPFILQPHESKEFQVRVFPLKAGYYHVHSTFVSDEGPAVSRGASVLVTGQTSPTSGEIALVYVPLGLGATALIVLSILTTRRSRGLGFKEKVVRYFFVIKSSFETLWLSGIMFWMAIALPAYLYSLEQTNAMLAAVLIGLAAITIGGYFAVITKPSTQQRIIAIGTCIGTIAFYIALEYAGFGDRRFYYYPQINPYAFGTFAIVANFVGLIGISILFIKFSLLARWKTRAE